MACNTCGQTEPNLTCVDCNPPTVECPQAQPCSSVNSTDCTIYTGTDILCNLDTVVSNSDTTTTALEKIVAYFCQKIKAITDINDSQTVLITELQNTVTIQQTEINALSLTVSTLNEQMSGVQTDITSLQAADAEFSAVIANHESRITVLETP